MRPDMLQPVHVSHDGFSQIRQIPFSEVSQRQFPQTLRQADPHILNFTVYQTVCCPVLLHMGNQ